MDETFMYVSVHEERSVGVVRSDDRDGNRRAPS
jgi:hypothetical protein